MTIHVYCLVQYSRVSAKTLLPIVVAEDDIRRSSSRLIVLRGERPADCTADAQHSKVIARHKFRVRSLCYALPAYIDSAGISRHDAAEYISRPVAKAEIYRV